MEAVQSLPDSPFRRALVDLSFFSVHRDH